MSAKLLLLQFCCLASLLVLPLLANVGGQPSGFFCDFDKKCRWRNGTNGIEDTSDWMIGNSLLWNRDQNMPKSKDALSDNFAYVTATMKREGWQTALLLSDVIPCQQGGLLSFYFWKTADLPTLEVCIRSPPINAAILNCFENVAAEVPSQQWVMKRTKIPPMGAPFQLVLKASFKRNFDVVGLDEISYNAQFCDAYKTRSIGTVKLHHRLKKRRRRESTEMRPFLITDQKVHYRRVVSSKKKSKSQEERNQRLSNIKQQLQQQQQASASASVAPPLAGAKAVTTPPWAFWAKHALPLASQLVSTLRDPPQPVHDLGSGLERTFGNRVVAGSNALPLPFEAQYALPVQPFVVSRFAEPEVRNSLTELEPVIFIRGRATTTNRTGCSSGALR